MPERDVVSNFAEKARIVVHLETAYDIVDELASSPERYIENLHKLSRLATKVYNDLLKKMETLDKGPDREEVNKALKNLSFWVMDMEEFINDLKRSGDKERYEKIKEFAALAVSPSGFVQRLKEIMEGSTPKEKGGQS